MAVGDGNGALPTPNPAQTALVHELRRAPLNTLTIDPVNTNQIIAEQVIPEDVGGWWIREIGLYDSKGDLIAIANCAETYKPLLQEGSGRMQVIRVILIVSSTQAVTLKIDPSVVLATRQYVDDQIIQVKAFVDQQLAAHIAAADPHKQYAPKASPALTGTPTAPTAAQTVNNTQIATTEFVKSAIAALVASSPAALDTLNELAAALGNDPNFATTVTNALAGKQPLDSTLTDLSGKTVNGILQYLRLERFDQDTNETRIWSPDKKSYILVQNGVWGAYSTNSPAGTLPLGLGFGGTGAKDAEGARTSLGLGNSATRNVGTVSGTVAAGDDSRITGAMQKNQNGNDIPDKTAFRSSIGLGSAATRAVGNGANQIPDMSFFSAELAINGWAKLPNGLIIQQGTSTAATPSSPDVLVNFPIPFPTGVLHIGEHDSNGGLSMTLWQLNNITRTAFYAGALGGVTRGNTTIRALATSTSCNWFVIGY